MAAVPSPDKTGEIRSASSGSGQHALTSNTAIVIGGASGDLAKKKVSHQPDPATSATSVLHHSCPAARGSREGPDRSGMTHPHQQRPPVPSPRAGGPRDGQSARTPGQTRQHKLQPRVLN